MAMEGKIAATQDEIEVVRTRRAELDALNIGEDKQPMRKSSLYRLSLAVQSVRKGSRARSSREKAAPSQSQGDRPRSTMRFPWASRKRASKKRNV